ncbi:MAG: hypothetical protein OXR82_18140 [Gammaproteobacteria bacterium]|nr:hypothetical protein [Gammaproteobacteria bacterium]
MKKMSRRVAKRWFWGVATVMLLTPVIPFVILFVQVSGASDPQALPGIFSEILPGAVALYRVSKVLAIIGLLMMIGLVFARMSGWTVSKQDSKVAGGLTR